jgi:hypothetical protein
MFTSATKSGLSGSGRATVSSVGLSVPTLASIVQIVPVLDYFVLFFEALIFGT